jgi:hypothetical protein
MNILIQYREQIVIDSIKVIGQVTNGRMMHENGVWVYSCEMPEGIYRYKFLINDKLLLNDPMADYYTWNSYGSWTVLIVDHNGNKVTKGKDSRIQLLDYCLSTSCNQDIQQYSKKIFDITVLEKAVARFLFGNVRGIHFITVAWYDPYDQLYEYSENQLNPENESVIQWFWLPFCIDMAEGKWTMRLFIDGAYVLEDKFELFQMKNSIKTGNHNFFI